MKFVVRPVQSADVTDVIALIADVLPEFGMEFGIGSATDEQVRELPHSYTTHGGQFWVAHREGTLLGTCGMFPLDKETVELRKMYLRPASRGLGLGAELLEVAIKWARTSGAARIVLDTAEAMKRAIAFYEARGFVRDDSFIRGPRCSRGYVLVL